MDSELANGYAALGDMDKAFHHLNACYEKRAGSIMFSLRIRSVYYILKMNASGNCLRKWI
jgi:hypothetical protein